MRRVYAVLALLLLLALPAEAGQLNVLSPYPAEVYLRPSGQGQFKLAATTTPATLTVESGRLYDLRLVARISLLQQARGEQPKVSDGTSVTIPMEVEWDIPRLAMIAVVLAALIGAVAGYLLRTRRSRPNLVFVEHDATPREPASVSVSRVISILPEGHRIGPYRVVVPIARGGMGSVYEVEDPYGDHFAMKIPDYQVLEDAEYSARFQREVQIGKELHHPNIVRIFDYNLGESGPDPYIILELVRGTTLKLLMQIERPMSIERAGYFLTCILSALEYGHQRHIVHRDVKPGNVLVGDNDVCKVSDYGIARMLQLNTLTATSSAIGTPVYMAPEQVQAKNADARVDVYAAGVVLFEMLTGQVPFDGEEQYAVLMRKLAMDPPNASEFNPSLPREIDTLLLRAMARHPDERYQTAQAFLDDLTQLLANYTHR